MHDCLVIPETQEYMNNDKRTVFPVNPCETCTALVEEADNVSVTLTLKDMIIDVMQTNKVQLKGKNGICKATALQQKVFFKSAQNRLILLAGTHRRLSLLQCDLDGQSALGWRCCNKYYQQKNIFSPFSQQPPDHYVNWRL